MQGVGDTCGEKSRGRTSGAATIVFSPSIEKRLKRSRASYSSVTEWCFEKFSTAKPSRCLGVIFCEYIVDWKRAERYVVVALWPDSRANNSRQPKLCNCSGLSAARLPT